MKNRSFILLLLASLFAFNNCSDEVAGTKDINYVSFETNTPPIIVEKDGAVDTDIHVYTTQITGSDRTFDIHVISDTLVTTANAESYNLPTTVTVPANSNVGTLTIHAVDSNLGEDPVEVGLQFAASSGLLTGSKISLTIQKHCTVNINDFVGVYSGNTRGGWGPTKVVTSLDENGNLQITGIGVSFLTGYWGEVITSMETLPMNVDLVSGNFTITKAPYITTTYNSEAQPTYYLSASGYLNACSGTLYLYYDFEQEGVGSYVDYLGNQAYFTEIIKIN